ncbi:hypothetical protein Tco_1449654 [Tanacetum coccineum]
MTSKAQQLELDNALVAPEKRRVIGKCNMRINPGMKPKEPTYQFWDTVTKHKIQGQEFDEPLTAEEALSFIRELGHSGEIKYITDVIVDHLHQPWRTFASIINKCLCGKDLAYQIDNMDSKKQDKMFYPRFTKIIIHHFLDKDKFISIRNRTFMHTARDDSLLGTMRFVSRHADTQVYGAILPKAMTNQAVLDSVAYKTYYPIALGAEPLKSRKSQKKSDSAISSEESPSKKKSAKAKKVTATKPKPTKKKALVKADRGKGLNVLSKVALSEAAQLKEATKRSKKDFHISQASGLGDGTNFESRVPDEQHHKTSGDSGKEDDDDEDDTEDDEEDDDTNDDDKKTDYNRTESDIIKIHVLNQSSTEYYEEEEEKINDEEKMDEEEVDEVTKELYNDVNSGFEQVEEDAHVTLTPVLNTQKVDESVQSSSVSSDFTSKLLNLENPSPADNEISSLMDTTARHVMVVPEITSVFTTTIPPPPPFFNPLPQQATPTPTPTTSEATTSFPSLLDFSSYAQALSSIPVIVDHYIDNKLGEAIQKAIVAHNLDCREEAQAEKRDYIELIDTSMRAILKEEVNTQLPQILPQAVSEFATPVIEKNVKESLEATVLARSPSQPKSTYEEAASLSEFELTKILIDKMEKNKSYDKVDYKRELYDALVKSYQTDKDLIDTYGEVFTLKRSRDDKDKDRDPSAGSDQGTKRRKSSKEAESSRDSSYTFDDSGVQHDQEFDTGNNDEQPVDKETWICQVAHAKEPRTSFDELMDTSFDFSTFVLNWLNIKYLTQDILVGLAFELLKGTYKSLTKLEYHLEECSKATTEQLDWHNLEGKPYPFDLSKPLPLIPDQQGRQVIPQDFFINNDLEYLKGGDLSRRYSTLVTKTKAATYEIKWIEDLVRNLWSPMKVVYDKHAYWGTSH